MRAWTTDTAVDFLSRACDADAAPFSRRATALPAAVRRWQELGLEPNDLVLLSLPNGVDLLDHWFAVQEAGGVPALVPLGPAGRLTELAAALKPRAVLTTAAAQKLPFDHVEPFLGHRVSITAPAPAPTRAGEVVLLTSGTSGLASACVFTREQLLSNAARHARSIGQTAADVVSVHLPLYFSFALVAQALGTLVTGGRVVIGSSPFHGQTFHRTAEAHGVTVSSLTPVLVRTVLEDRGSWPQGVRVLTVGGDRLDAQVVERLLAARPGRELYLTYGLTQAGPRVSTLPAHAVAPSRYASVGRPLDGVEADLRDPDPTTGVGELLIRSDTAMTRRLGVIEGRGNDWFQPGVLATGDNFRIEDGYLFFAGRVSDWVKVRGEKVSLASVRRIAALLPDVVTARTRPVEGEDGYDLFLTYRGELPTTAAALGELRKRLRPAELPRAVHVLDAGSQPPPHK